MDVLVTVAPNAPWTLWDLSRMRAELESIFGREVDLVDKKALIVDQRNVLIHAYYEIEIERIWALAQQDIPRLLEQLEKLMPPEEG